MSARDILLREEGVNHVDTLNATRRVGRILVYQSKPIEAEAMLRDVLARAEATLGPDHEVAIYCVSDLAIALRRQRRFADAEPFYRRAVEGANRLHGEFSNESADTMNNFAVLLSEMNQETEALEMYQKTLNIRRGRGPDHPTIFTSLGNIAKTLQNLGRLAEAEDAAREALAGRRRVLKDDHRQTLLSINDLAWILAERKQFEEAIALNNEALERRRRLLSDKDPELLQSTNALGRILALAGRPQEAEPLLLETVNKRREVLGTAHPFTLGSMVALEGVYETLQKWPEADALLAELASPAAQSALPAPHRAMVNARRGIRLVAKADFSAAEPLLVETKMSLQSARVPNTELIRSVIDALITVYEQTARPELAAPLRAEREQLLNRPASTQAASRPA
jgi:tetratricopeptide (TPR) repeat protein